MEQQQRQIIMKTVALHQFSWTGAHDTHRAKARTYFFVIFYFIIRLLPMYLSSEHEWNEMNIFSRFFFFFFFFFIIYFSLRLVGLMPLGCEWIFVCTSAIKLFSSRVSSAVHLRYTKILRVYKSNGIIHYNVSSCQRSL